MAQAKTRQPQGPATGKSQASAKANRAKAKPAATRPVKPLRTLNKTKTHRVRNFICAVIAFIFALAALLGTVTHILPEELQALPYMPIVVSLVPWFTLLAVIALVCAIVSKRTVSIVMAVLAIALQAFWQYPFFYQPSKLSRAAVAAASGETVNTDDGYARLMTCNVYKGRADAREQLLDVVALLEIGDEAAAPAETFGRIAALLKQRAQFSAHLQMGGGQFQMIALLGVRDAAPGKKGSPQKRRPVAGLLQQSEVDMEHQILFGVKP